MRVVALVVLAAFPAALASPAVGTERGLALLHELEADVHALDAQIGRSTHDAKHRGAFGGLERRTIAEDIAAEILTAFSMVNAWVNDDKANEAHTANEQLEAEVLRALVRDPKFKNVAAVSAPAAAALKAEMERLYLKLHGFRWID